MAVGDTLYVGVTGQYLSSYICNYYSDNGNPTSITNKYCTYNAPFTYSTTGTHNPYIISAGYTKVCQNDPVNVYSPCTTSNVKGTDTVVNTTQCVGPTGTLSNNLLWHDENSKGYGCGQASDVCWGGYCRAGSTWNASRGKCVETNCNDGKDNNGGQGHISEPSYTSFPQTSFHPVFRAMSLT